MVKPDDSSLDPEDRRAVEERAHRLLDRAAAWQRFPTPVADILETAKLRLAPTSAFDVDAILSYLRGKATDAARSVKEAISKVFGLYDAVDDVIHIDVTVGEAKQNFLKLHETGHHELPTHRKLFRLFQECDKTLAPEIADQFEREANNFARYTLFQGNAYWRMAADCALSIKTPMRLAKMFGASQYASAREYARTHHKACVVYILEPIEFLPGGKPRALVRRIEPSPAFTQRFGALSDVVITLDHVLGRVLPIGRKMTRPLQLGLKDQNGIMHECLAEAFDTKWNVLILLYPVRELTAATIILPPIPFGLAAK